MSSASSGSSGYVSDLPIRLNKKFYPIPTSVRDGLNNRGVIDMELRFPSELLSNEYDFSMEKRAVQDFHTNLQRYTTLETPRSAETDQQQHPLENDSSVESECSTIVSSSASSSYSSIPASEDAPLDSTAAVGNLSFVSNGINHAGFPSMAQQVHHANSTYSNGGHGGRFSDAMIPRPGLDNLSITHVSGFRPSTTMVNSNGSTKSVDGNAIDGLLYPPVPTLSTYRTVPAIDRQSLTPAASIHRSSSVNPTAQPSVVNSHGGRPSMTSFPTIDGLSNSVAPVRSPISAAANFRSFPANGILQPVIADKMPSSSNISADGQSKQSSMMRLRLEEFENSPCNPFDMVELKSINDIEELRRLWTSNGDPPRNNNGY